MQRPNTWVWQSLDLGRLGGLVSRFTATRGSLSLLSFGYGRSHRRSPWPSSCVDGFILRARNPDTGCTVQQQVLRCRKSLIRWPRVFSKALVAVGNIMGGMPCTYRPYPMINGLSTWWLRSIFSLSAQCGRTLCELDGGPLIRPAAIRIVCIQGAATDRRADQAPAG